LSSVRHIDRIPLITGPTAVGKTAVAVALAKTIGAEIISADSRQVYRELTVGTAKPDDVEMDGVRHHFIDEVNLPAVVSAGWFEREATHRIREILGRGMNVVVVGGSTLYVHALVSGLADIPNVDPSLVDELNSQIAAGRASDLYGELTTADPEFAQTLDPTKTQRLVRGLAVFRGTGRPLSSFFHSATPSFDYEVVVMGMRREQLYSRINDRARDMVEAGLLDEASALLAAGFDRNLSPLRTIGYSEAFDYLDGQIPSRAEFERLLMRNTRRYAKRQMTWFRRYGEEAVLTTSADTDRLVGEITTRASA